MEGGKKMSLRRFFAESQGQKSRELTTPPEPPILGTMLPVPSLSVRTAHIELRAARAFP